MGVDTHGLEAIRNSAENFRDELGDKPGNSFIKTLNGWLFQRVGRKITAEYPTTLTELYHFKQGSTLIATYLVTYQDVDKNIFLEAERIA